MVNQLIYSKLIECVNLDDIFIKDLSTTRNPVSLNDGEELQAEVQMLPQLQLFSEHHLIAAVNFEVSAQTREAIELFKMQFEYVTVYSIHTDEIFPKEELETAAELFVSRNVPINVWPFARELVADLSNRMNVPRLIIGMYRYLPEIAAEEEANDRD